MENFKHITNALHKETCKSLTDYLKQESKKGRVWQDPQAPLSDALLFFDATLDQVLEEFLPRMEQETGKKLFPTYSYSRYYKKGEVLKCHTDRPACEYSTTIYLNSSNPEYPYPIFVDNIAITLREGQGLVYKGCEQEHWREPYPYDFSNHVFLHYIEQKEENRKYKYDQREYLYRTAVEPNKTQG